MARFLGIPSRESAGPVAGLIVVVNALLGFWLLLSLSD